jgi:hypothetical protein
VNAVLLMKGKMSEEELCDILQKGLLVHKRMRERVAKRRFLFMYWVRLSSIEPFVPN